MVYDASLGTTYLHGLESTESLTLTGGALELNSFSWTTRTLTVGAGTSITVFGAFDQSGGSVTGLGMVTVEGLMTWTSGTQSGAGETVANGGAAISSNNDKFLDTRTLTLNAASTGFGDLRVSNGATINNNADLDILFDSPLADAGGVDSTFNNHAGLTKSGGVGNIDIRANFVNTGSVTVDSGSITFDRDFTQTDTGMLNVGIAGLAPDFDSFSVSQTADLAGTLEITLLGGYVPDLLDPPYAIMTFASRIDTFGTVNGLVFDPGVRRFDIIYGGTSITLVVVSDP